MVVPKHTPEYLRERQPLWEQLWKELDAVWKQVEDGVMTLAAYQIQVQPITERYDKQLKPIWEKHLKLQGESV